MFQLRRVLLFPIIQVMQLHFFSTICSLILKSLHRRTFIFFNSNSVTGSRHTSNSTEQQHFELSISTTSPSTVIRSEQ